MVKIKVNITRGGDVNLDFIGFSGYECEGERKRFTNLLLNYGVQLSPENITKKNTNQINLETGFSPTKKSRVEVR